MNVIEDCDDEERDVDAFVLYKSSTDKKWPGVAGEWALLFTFQQGQNRIFHLFTVEECSGNLIGIKSNFNENCTFGPIFSTNFDF